MKIYLVAFVAGLTAVSSISAQEPGSRRGFDPAEMVERIFENDANSDGKISKDELPERMQRIFDRADGDSDGFITKDELTSMFEQRGGGGGGGVRRGGPGGGQGGQGGMSAERLMQAIPLVVALDADKNGELSKAEIENAVKALQSLDKNKDGKISTEEMMPDMAQFGRGGGRGGRGEGGRGGRGGGRGEGARGGGDRQRRPAFEDDGSK